jgi:hypothetical protein
LLKATLDELELGANELELQTDELDFEKTMLPEQNSVDGL